MSKILKIDKKEINSMAHPSGSYNTNTLTVLKDLNIDIGFKQIMDNDKNKNSCYEIPRQDHSAILKKYLNENYIIYIKSAKTQLFYKNLLSKNCKELFVVQESKTIFPGKVPGSYATSKD